jgi:hypothetical protein
MPITLILADDDDGRVDGRELQPLDELGSDDRLLRGLLLALVSTRRDDSANAPASVAAGDDDPAAA